jgi:hypothetical protein
MPQTPLRAEQYVQSIDPCVKVISLAVPVGAESNGGWKHEGAFRTGQQLQPYRRSGTRVGQVQRRRLCFLQLPPCVPELNPAELL